MRRLTGKILHFDNSAWADTPIYLQLNNGTYSATEIYPSDLKTIETLADGSFSVYLQPNLGVENNYYTLILPDNKEIPFTIPSGTKDIALSTIIEIGAIVSSPSYPNVLQYLQDYIDDSLSNVEASANISDIYISESVISALRVVKYNTVTGKILYATTSDVSDMGKAIGVTSQSGNANDQVQVITSGYLSDDNWNWTLGRPIFFGDNGILTQTQGTAYYQIVAVPTRPNRILVTLEESIAL